METIFEQLRQRQDESGLLREAVQTALKQYFLVDPKYSIPLTLDQRLSSLRILSHTWSASSKQANMIK